MVFNGGSVGDPGITISYSNWTINNVPTYGTSTIGPSPLPIGYSSQNYSQQLTFTGDVVAPVTFEHAATPGQTYSGNGQPYFNPLPDGISLSSTGLLSGTIGPNYFGLATVWVKATDSRQHSVTSQLTWPIIRLSAGRIAPSSLPAGTQNTAYNQQLSVTQGPGGPYKFATTGSLPTGLSLTSAGLLSGTPTVTGTFPINIVAGYDTDDNDPTNDYDRYTASYSLLINSASTPTPTTTLSLILNGYSSNGNPSGPAVAETDSQPFISIQLYNTYANNGAYIDSTGYDRVTWTISGTGITAGDISSIIVYNGPTNVTPIFISPVTSLTGTIDLTFFNAGNYDSMIGVMTIFIATDGLNEVDETLTFTATFGSQTVSDTINIRDTR